jgi:hypothetical protein
MPDEQTMGGQKPKGKKEGLFASLAGWQKVLLLVFALIIFFLIWNFVFGGIKNVYQLFAFVAAFGAIIVLGFIVLTAVQWYLQPEYFSPKKDFRTRLVNTSIDLKPPNVNDLFYRGSKDKRRVRGGHIIGLMGIPYLIGDIEKDANGEIQYEDAKILKNTKIPKFSKISYGLDGDTLFVYESGWFLFKRRHYLRCNNQKHGDLNGDVDVYDINPIPVGDFFEYPYTQVQKEPAKIMLQHQMETIIATYDHQQDLISQGVDAAIFFNPFFRFVEKQNAELAASR